MDSLLEFKRSTKKRIGPSIRFFVHNFGRPIARSDLPQQSRGHQQTSFSHEFFAKYKYKYAANWLLNILHNGK